MDIAIVTSMMFVAQVHKIINIYIYRYDFYEKLINVSIDHCLVVYWTSDIMDWFDDGCYLCVLCVKLMCSSCCFSGFILGLVKYTLNIYIVTQSMR